jgi:glyoxylase-like metal-dependent hydrolase (beta-lactamase superfamily II)
MARKSKPENAAPQETGWWVDRSCIDCGASQYLAPTFIGARNGISYFERQPETPDEELAAWRALLACPTASVHAPAGMKPPAGLFPQALSDTVWRLGYNARASFGSMSYFATAGDMNFMIDSPRWTNHLKTWMSARGGLDHVLLTHRDDVADADRYAEEFGAEVWIHAADVSAAPYADHVIEGDALQEPLPGVKILPVPGHTRGSVMFLFDDTFLFTGDSLSWSFVENRLVARREVCWYDWDSQLASLARVAEELSFAWVLPGHGGHVHAPAEDLHRELDDMLARFDVRAAQ